MRTLSAITAAVCYVSVLVCTQPALAQEQPRLDTKSIPELVRQLGSAIYQEREAATKALMPCDEALPYLRRALKTANPEATRRTKTILLAIAQRSLPRYVEYGRKGRIDVLVGIVGRVSPIARH
jgi:hypothetical protein